MYFISLCFVLNHLLQWHACILPSVSTIQVSQEQRATKIIKTQGHQGLREVYGEVLTSSPVIQK